MKTLSRRQAMKLGSAFAAAAPFASGVQGLAEEAKPSPEPIVFDMAGFSAAEPIFGKTGTCTDNRTPVHLGWFGSYNEVAGRKLAVVVLLTSGQHSVSGPIASGVAGAVYKNLSEENYYAHATPQISPATLVSNYSY